MNHGVIISVNTLNSVSISEGIEFRMCRPPCFTREADACWLAPYRMSILSSLSADWLLQGTQMHFWSWVCFAVQRDGP